MPASNFCVRLGGVSDVQGKNNTGETRVSGLQMQRKGGFRALEAHDAMGRS